MQELAPLATTASSLTEQLENYLHSHVDEICAVMGVPAGTRLRVRIRGAATPIETRLDVDEATLEIGEDDAQRVMACIRSCNWGNGIVLVPTLARPVLAGAFAGLQPGQPRTLLSLAKSRKTDPTRNLGLLWGALNLLALCGWVTLSGGDEQAEYRLTASGACAVNCVQARRVLFAQLAEATSMLQHLHALCHARRTHAEHSASYAELVRICCNGWPLPDAGSPLEWRVRNQLCAAMDGLLLGPTWVALDMPVFEEQDGCSTKVAAGILDRFDEHDDWVPTTRGWPHADPVVLDAAWTLMSQAGMVDIDRVGERVRLNRAGRIHRPIAAPYAGLPGSYLRSYAVLDELLFGNPDPLGVDEDGHIDRVMNVYASSGAGSGPACREMATKIIQRVFDETPLDEQPAGIADIGCGDASALKRLAQHVVQSTRRGRHLAQRPLLVVAADYNEAARARAADTLADLSAMPGVEARVLHADISDPDRYDRTVADSGLMVTVNGKDNAMRPARLSDFLHTNMFLLHNRRLIVRRREAADAILERRLREADRSRLRKVVEKHFFGQLTVSDHGPLPIPLADIKAAFRVAHSDAEGLVPGYVAAADLIELIARWKPHIGHGFVAVEGHSPWAANLLEEASAEPGRFTRSEVLPAVFNWGMHFLSRQFMMPFNEFMLAMCLSGLSPRDGVHGRIHPEGFPGLDLMSDYRFFSIADYVPH